MASPAGVCPSWAGAASVGVWGSFSLMPFCSSWGSFFSIIWALEISKTPFWLMRTLTLTSCASPVGDGFTSFTFHSPKTEERWSFIECLWRKGLTDEWIQAWWWIWVIQFNSKRVATGHCEQATEWSSVVDREDFHVRSLTVLVVERYHHRVRLNINDTEVANSDSWRHDCALQCTASWNSFILVQRCAWRLAKDLLDELLHSWNSRWSAHDLDGVNVFQAQLWIPQAPLHDIFNAKEQTLANLFHVHALDRRRDVSVVHEALDIEWKFRAVGAHLFLKLFDFGH